MAGLSEIPAIVLEKDDEQTARIALVENLQREDLNPVEEAMAYCSLAEEYNMTQEELANEVGKSRSAVANAMRLLDLPDEVLALVANRTLSAGHARALLGLKNEDRMLDLAQKIIEKELSVRDVEKTVRLFNYVPEETAGDESNIEVQKKAHMKDLEHRAVTHLGRKVRILKTAKKKVVELAYSDDEDLEALLKSICGETFFAEND
jgi:ParB family chromosome partitioning protein